MNQKGFISILAIIGLVILVGVIGYFVVSPQTPSATPPAPTTPQPTNTCPDDVITCTFGGKGESSYPIELHRDPTTCEFPACPG